MAVATAKVIGDGAEALGFGIQARWWRPRCWSLYLRLASGRTIWPCLSNRPTHPFS
jgi:hypothetical protein